MSLDKQHYGVKVERDSMCMNLDISYYYT